VAGRARSCAWAYGRTRRGVTPRKPGGSVPFTQAVRGPANADRSSLMSWPKPRQMGAGRNRRARRSASGDNQGIDWLIRDATPMSHPNRRAVPAPSLSCARGSSTRSWAKDDANPRIRAHPRAAPGAPGLHLLLRCSSTVGHWVLTFANGSRDVSLEHKTDGMFERSPSHHQHSHPLQTQALVDRLATSLAYNLNRPLPNRALFRAGWPDLFAQPSAQPNPKIAVQC